MIFIGDIALPHLGAIECEPLPESLRGKRWIGNLEGALVKNAHPVSDAVYNEFQAIQNLIRNFDFVAFTLANNHIFDTGTLSQTKNLLDKLQLLYCGAGGNILEANSEIVITEGDTEIILINFGWEVIQCEPANHRKSGVNPLSKIHILETISKLVNKYPNGKIVPFMHWSYELEGEPQPFERELAKAMIELGAAGVIGSHPHRVGGFELYNGKPIVYSLGNWLFKQNYYMNGSVKFPNFCNLELAFEWDFERDTFLFHFFNFDPIASVLNYSHTEGPDSETMRKLTPFRGLSQIEYKRWYKQNHYHRNKGLPIYYWEDSDFKILMKNKINKLRDVAINLYRVFRQIFLR